MSDEEQRWEEYLSHLSEEVVGFWHLMADAVPDLPIPQAGPFDGGFQFAWNSDVYYVDVDLLANGDCEWFSRDRVTKETDSGEFLLDDSLPMQLWRALSRAANVRRSR